MIAAVYLSTSAHWSEAEKVEAKRVRSGKIHFDGTKRSRNRSAPINEQLSHKLSRRLNQSGFKMFCNDFTPDLSEMESGRSVKRSCFLNPLVTIPSLLNAMAKYTVFCRISCQCRELLHNDRTICRLSCQHWV